MTPELFKFGQSVRLERVKRGLTLKEVAHEVLNNQERKGYVSQIENGKRRLNALTIHKFSSYFELSEDIVDAVLGVDLPNEDGGTDIDLQVEKMLAEKEELAARLKISESLVIALAYRYAQSGIIRPAVPI